MNEKKLIKWLNDEIKRAKKDSKSWKKDLSKYALKDDYEMMFQSVDAINYNIACEDICSELLEMIKEGD